MARNAYTKSVSKTNKLTGTRTNQVINTGKMSGSQQYRLQRMDKINRRKAQNLRAEQIRAVGQAASSVTGSVMTPKAVEAASYNELKKKESDSMKQMTDSLNKWLEIMESNPDKSSGEDGVKNNPNPSGSSGSKLND